MSQSLPSRRLQPPHRSKSLAEVAELADAHGSGPCTRKGVGVRVPSSAPRFLNSLTSPVRRLTHSRVGPIVPVILREQINGNEARIKLSAVHQARCEQFLQTGHV